MSYKIDFALGDHVILEPMDKSSVLKAEEISTVFKVISFGWNIKDMSVVAYTKSDREVTFGDLVIVEPSSIKQCTMGDKTVYWVYMSELLAKVING